MLRGINQQDIFFENQDYFKFQEIIKNTKEKFSYKLYSYVLMPNHIHLEIKDENQKLSQIIHSITTSYANYFNKKYQRKGHLFENRFNSRNVESLYYVFNLIRYIHQNPVKSGISEIDKYIWSSYLEYFEENKTNIKNKITDTEEILSVIPLQKDKAKEEFYNFNRKTIKFEESIELLEYEMRNKLTDDEIIYFIKKKLGINNIQEIQSYNKNHRDYIIRKLINIKGMTQPQMSRILGINIRVIRKAIYET